MDPKTTIHYLMEYYAAGRKKELIHSMTEWMEPERFMLSEISQVVKEKYHMISPIVGLSQENEKASQI